MGTLQQLKILALSCVQHILLQFSKGAVEQTKNSVDFVPPAPCWDKIQTFTYFLFDGALED